MKSHNNCAFREEIIVKWTYSIYNYVQQYTFSESLAYAGRDLSAFESWGYYVVPEKCENIHLVHVIFAIYINSWKF